MYNSVEDAKWTMVGWSMVGALCIAYAVYRYVQTSRYSGSVDGRVVDSVCSLVRTLFRCSLKIEYMIPDSSDANVLRVHSRPFEVTARKQYYKGDPIALLYDPSNPNDVFYGMRASSQVYIWAGIGIAIILASIAYYMYVRNKYVNQ